MVIPNLKSTTISIAMKAKLHSTLNSGSLPLNTSAIRLDLVKKRLSIQPMSSKQWLYSC